MRKLLVMAALALAACADSPPAPYNPNSPPPPRAEGLHDAMLACIAYVMGEKSEAAAMAAAGMSRADAALQNPLVSHDYDHHYARQGPTPARLTIPAGYHAPGNPACYMVVHGDALDAYREAAARAFTERFGGDFAAQAPHHYDSPVPRMHTSDFYFCRAGLLIDAFRTTWSTGKAPAYEVKIDRAWVTPGLAPICG